MSIVLLLYGSDSGGLWRIQPIISDQIWDSEFVCHFGICNLQHHHRYCKRMTRVSIGFFE